MKERLMSKKTRPTQLEGIIHVTGEHDTGKTTFALECGANPDRILFIDDDVKGRSTVNELIGSGASFGRYIDLVELSDKKTEYTFHMSVMEIIKGVQKEQYDCIIWDTWTRFASTCHSYVMKHPREFRETWAPMGTIKGAQQWQEARRYEAAILNYMAQRTKTLILVTHLKDYYMGSAKVPNKQIPASSKVLMQVPRFRIWLRQNESGSPVPIGLVLKRLDTKLLTDKGIRTVSVLPRKLVPAPDEASLWDTIWRYWEDPIGLRVPTDVEVPNEFELSILDGTLTPDQARTFRMMLESGQIGQDEEEVRIVDDLPSDEVVDLIREQYNEKKSAPSIAKSLDLSIPIVLRVINEVINPEVSFS